MFVIKQNDLLPNMECQLLDCEGKPFNLELCSIKFHMVNSSKDVVINREIDVVNIEDGKVEVVWVEGDTENSGIYRCEFEINMPDGKPISIPNDGYFLIQIVPELA